VAAPPEPEAVLKPAAPDPTGPLDVTMVRAAELMLNQQDGGKSLAVGKYMANGGGIDGTVSRMVLYPNGAVLVTVTKRKRIGDVVASDDRYIVLRGDLECEVVV
jgi:hypothetical protein